MKQGRPTPPFRETQEEEEMLQMRRSFLPLAQGESFDTAARLMFPTRPEEVLTTESGQRS